MAQSKYESHVAPRLVEVAAWCRDGMIEEDVARKLGVGYSTFNEYKKQHPELLEAVKKGKEVADIEVENALYKSALGYTVTIRKAFKVKHVEYENGKRVSENEEVVLADEEVHVPASNTAQIFWLKNRKPSEWRDKTETEHSGSVTHILDPEPMTKPVSSGRT